MAAMAGQAHPTQLRDGIGGVGDYAFARQGCGEGRPDFYTFNATNSKGKFMAMQGNRKKKGLMFALLTALALMMFMPAAYAQQVYKSMTSGQIKAIMEGEGYAVSTNDSGKVVWKIDGNKAAMLVGSDGTSLQFYAGFSGGGSSLAKVNKWNKDKRYSRSYIDDEGDPVLELDLDLTGGVTRERILDFLRTAKISFTAWRDEVVE